MTPEEETRPAALLAAIPPLGETPGDELLTLVSSHTLRRSPWAQPSCTRRRSRATSTSSSSADTDSTVTSLADIKLAAFTPVEGNRQFPWKRAQTQRYLGLQKNLYWMRMVTVNMTAPCTAMAKRFFPTMSQPRGALNRSSPGGREKNKNKRVKTMFPSHRRGQPPLL